LRSIAPKLLLVLWRTLELVHITHGTALPGGLPKVDLTLHRHASRSRPHFRRRIGRLFGQTVMGNLRRPGVECQYARQDEVMLEQAFFDSGQLSDIKSQDWGSSMARSRLKVFFDGGCRPNPGRMEAAVVIRGVAHFFDELGYGSNTDAEWLALICAIELSGSLGLTNVEFVGDALEVVQKSNTAVKSGGARLAHSAKVLALISNMPPVRIRWIKREQNLAGIALAARHPR